MVYVVKLPYVYREYLEQELTLENDKTQEICNAVISHLNKVAIQLRHLFLVEDLMDSAKFGGFLYFLTYLGSWFNGLTLLILGKFRHFCHEGTFGELS